MSGKKSPYSVEVKVLKRIKSRPKGSVFTPDMFLDLGSRAAVDVALSRHAKEGNIRRLGWGLYDRPRNHPTLGMLYPPVDAVVDAVVRRDAVRIQPSGAYAANLLGLSGQMPMRVVFLTDGPSRRIRLGTQEIQFKRTTPRNMAVAGGIGGLVIQALRHIGRNNVDDGVVLSLQKKLGAKEKKELVRDARYAPAWIAEIMRKIAGDAA